MRRNLLILAFCGCVLLGTSTGCQTKYWSLYMTRQILDAISEDHFFCNRILTPGWAEGSWGGALTGARTGEEFLVGAVVMITAPVWGPVIVYGGAFAGDVAFLPVSLVHDLFVALFYPPEEEMLRRRKGHITRWYASGRKKV
jgi:hypothetical protein